MPLYSLLHPAWTSPALELYEKFRYIKFVLELELRYFSAMIRVCEQLYWGGVTNKDAEMSGIGDKFQHETKYEPDNMLLMNRD